MKVTNKVSNVLWYLAILPFLFPFGFADYFLAYKEFRVLLLGIATIAIIAREVYLIIANQGKMQISKPLLAVLVYHVALLVITLCIQGNITQGIQKIFVTPALCFLLDEGCKKNNECIINVICDLLIVDFVLNLFVFNQWFVPKYFLIDNHDNHLMFIGHVQTAAEVGILGLFIAYIEYSYGVYKKKSVILALLSVSTMIYSQTAASFIGLVIIAIFLVLSNFDEIKQFINNHEYVVLIIVLLVSIVMINITKTPLYKRYGSIITTSLSGRPFIWDVGLKLFQAKPIFGYGAYGVLIKVFWSAWDKNNLGFNYAHSTILQLLLDGGVVLASIFIFTVASYVKFADKKMRNNNIKYMSHILLLAFLSVGMVESLTEYYYIFIFLSIMLHLNEVDKMKCYRKK